MIIPITGQGAKNEEERFFADRRNPGEHHQIRITVDGEIYGTYSLDEDQTIRINDTNTCRIENGTARMIQADCPDHLCMKQNPVDKNGGTITCLPNRVVIEAVGGKDDVDIMVSAIW